MEMEMSEGENDYEEVIQRLMSKIQDGAQKAQSLSSSASIYRVPKEIRNLNESAYTPRLIAIGPLHRNDTHLQTPIQHVKLSYMNNLLYRMTRGMEDQEAEKKKILQECLAAMKTSIEDAKKCYADDVKLDEEMMFVDGCFILELLYRLFLYDIGTDSESEALEDSIFGNGMTMSIQHDLLLLENQIPFLVLEILFPLTLARILNKLRGKLSLTDFVFLPSVAYRMSPAIGYSTKSGSARTCCGPRDCVLWVSGNKMNNSKTEEKVSSRNAYHHILHKLHDDFLPSYQTNKGLLTQVMPSASELVYAGVKFVPGTGDNLFEVNFIEPEGLFWWCRSACFEIPTLRIVESTEPFLRNFIAFEKCCPSISQHFTSYAILMDMLVNSDKDVQVLEKAGVVHNWLGTSKVATDLFNNLCRGVEIGEFSFVDMCKRATKYSERSRPKNIADLKRQYFSSPWKFIAFCLGIVYFGLTVAQLIISIIIK